MPIKPENRKRYPDNWKQIREEVLARAGNACEFCGAENHSIVVRPVLDKYGDIVAKAVKIVLTVAHMDHIPENCNPDNLRALCQKCHLNYDLADNIEKARKTRLAKKLATRRDEAQLSLF